MLLIPVEILRFVNPDFPGFVECELVDAEGTRHLFMEKVPVVTLEHLTEHSVYPAAGVIACEVEASWMEPNGRALVRVTTERPWGVESVGGRSLFVLDPATLSHEDAA